LTCKHNGESRCASIGRGGRGAGSQRFCPCSRCLCPRLLTHASAVRYCASTRSFAKESGKLAAMAITTRYEVHMSLTYVCLLRPARDTVERQQSIAAVTFSYVLCPPKRQKLCKFVFFRTEVHVSCQDSQSPSIRARKSRQAGGGGRGRVNCISNFPRRSVGQISTIPVKAVKADFESPNPISPTHVSTRGVFIYIYIYKQVWWVGCAASVEFC